MNSKIEEVLNRKECVSIFSQVRSTHFSVTEEDSSIRRFVELVSSKKILYWKEGKHWKKFSFKKSNMSYVEDILFDVFLTSTKV